MNRIVHVNLGGTVSAADGIGSVIESLCRAQRLRGHEVLVLGPEHGPDRGTPLRTLLAATRQLSEFRPDIVHFHSVFRPIHAVLAGWCRRNSLPYVVSPHSAFAVAALQRDALRKKLWIRAVDGPMLRRASGVICLTGQERAEVMDVVPDAGTHVIPNLLSDAWQPASGTGRPASRSAGPPRVVTLARYDVYQKGLDRISAIAALLPGVDFVVYGTFDGNDPEAAGQLIRDAPPNLTFPGIVVGPEKMRVLAEADLYLQPSRWEGMSVAVLEAMRSGVPCVVSPEVALTLGDGAETVLVVPDNPGTAAEAVSQLLGDPTTTGGYAEDAQAWVDRTTDPDHVISALHQAYEHGVAILSSGRSDQRWSGSGTVLARVEKGRQK